MGVDFVHMRLLSVAAAPAIAVLLLTSPRPAAAHVVAEAMAHAPVGSPASEQSLDRGDSGPAVRRVQQALLAAGLTIVGGADGVFGSATANAVRMYQEAVGLPVTGVVDQSTAISLDLPLPERGDHGQAVKRLQQLLLTDGIQVEGGVDGRFGSATTEAVKTFQAGHGLPAAGVLDDATALKLGFTPMPDGVTLATQRAAKTGSSAPLAAFPVQGLCGYQDGWMDPRPEGRRHEGIDIIAPARKYIYAVADGIITRKLWDLPGRTSGNSLVLTSVDGSNTYYFYGHMLDFVPGLKKGARVKAGQIIGFVGSTGLSSTSHLHFEVHPGGGEAVNPFPLVKAVDGCDETKPGPTAFG